MRRLALVLAAGAALGVAASACTDSQARRVRHTLQRSSHGPQRPPPAPSGPVETEEAARSVALRYARDHGIPVERTHEVRVADGRWVVELRGAGDENRVWVAVDAATGRIVRARLRKPAGGLVLHAHDGYRDEDYGSPEP